MSQKNAISENLSVGGQPTKTDLGELYNEGFKSVVNLRTSGEIDSEEELTPDDERALAREYELAYLHLPVSAEDMNYKVVDLFKCEQPKMKEFFRSYLDHHAQSGQGAYNPR